jgi:acyl-CoA thioesterase-1
LSAKLQAAFVSTLAIVTTVPLLWFSPAAADSSPNAETIQLVAFGDSLSAGFMLPPEAAFPVKLEAALKEKGYDVAIANAGVSGDTASAGLSRVDWSVPEGTDGVILELGANDALRGVDIQVTRQALNDIANRLRERGIEVLIAGMLAPPNMGKAYADDFNSIFPALAKQHDFILYPFFLDGVAADPALNLDDGMHPSPQGVDVIVERILPYVERLIARIEQTSPSRSDG